MYYNCNTDDGKTNGVRMFGRGRIGSIAMLFADIHLNIISLFTSSRE